MDAKAGTFPTLGPRERQLLNLLWQMGSATVREIMEFGQITTAYTTVMTTLDRLYHKGVLNRSDEGRRAYRYTPRQTVEQFHVSFVVESIQRLFSATPEPQMLCSSLVETLKDHDPQLLDQLEKEIADKRSRLTHRQPKTSP